MYIWTERKRVSSNKSTYNHGERTKNVKEEDEGEKKIIVYVISAKVAI